MSAANETNTANGAADRAARPAAQGEDDGIIYQVVINHEEQYSIWPDYRGEPPAGWTCVGVQGPKARCLAHVNEVWTDMRPKSLRLRMAELEKAGPAPADEVAEPPPGDDARDDLVTFLATGSHPVKASVRPEATAALFKDAIDRGYVHICFDDTRGGTELGVRLDAAESRVANGDFVGATGNVHVEGTLELDDTPVRCIADIDLATLCGIGYLRKEDRRQPTPSGISDIGPR